MSELQNEEQQQQTPSSFENKSSSVQPEEILQQAEKLNVQLDEQKKQSDAAAARMAEMEKELAYHREKEAREAEAYKTAQMPKFQKWLEMEEADKPMPEKMKTGYEQAWTDIRFKDNADKLEEQMNRMISLQASAKAAEEKAKKLEDEKKALEQSVTASANAIKTISARNSVASAIGGTPAAQQQQQDKTPSDRKETDVNASLNLNQVMLRGPSDAELPFLQSYGYSSEIDVNASLHDRYGGGKTFRTSMKMPPRSRIDRDEDGQLNMPASARNIPGCDGLFAFMYEMRDDLVNSDLSHLVHVNASRNTIQRKNLSEWEEKNQARLSSRK